MVSKMKSIIIYVLSVILAFESGLIVIFACIASALHDEKKEEPRRKYGSRINYQNYYRNRKES